MTSLRVRPRPSPRPPPPPPRPPRPPQHECCRHPAPLRCPTAPTPSLSISRTAPSSPSRTAPSPTPFALPRRCMGTASTIQQARTMHRRRRHPTPTLRSHVRTPHSPYLTPHAPPPPPCFRLPTCHTCHTPHTPRSAAIQAPFQPQPFAAAPSPPARSRRPPAAGPLRRENPFARFSDPRLCEHPFVLFPKPPAPRAPLPHAHVPVHGA